MPVENSIPTAPQQTTPFVYNNDVTPEPTVVQPLENPTVLETPTANEIPQQPNVIPTPVTPEPQLNVIPGMNPTPQPTITPENPGNNPNNPMM